MTMTPSSRNNRHLVIFKVAPYTFCAPTGEVERFTTVPPISRLPKAPPAVIGVINHRGQVYRVISLRRKLGLETGPPKTEGQLILTRLPSGPTAFLVDKVVDVLPAARLAPHPVSPHSAMGLVDAFMLRDDQVLLHTRFDRIEQAKDTPFPSPDLKTLERLTVAVEEPDPPSGAEDDTDVKEVSGVSPLPEKREGRKTTPPGNAATKRPVPDWPPKAMSPRPGAAPRTSRPQTRPIAPPAREPKLKRPVRFKKPQQRARRYALALTAMLVLLLVVVFSSAWLIKGRLRGLERESGYAPSLPPAPIEKQNPPEPAVTAATSHPAPKKTQSENTLSSDSNDLSAPLSQKTPSASQPTTPPDVQAEPPPRQPPAEKKPPDPAPEAAMSSPREVLRLETETFTLMVERPSTNPAETIPQAPQPDSKAPSEITHVVVAGDTLWDIAAHYLGDPFQYPALARLSRIHDPDLIYPGDIIRIIPKPPR